ncbi:MAG: hypothetical protein JJ863_17290 [Deltaproteobacteria bacterium]|nr:hypothetical protein [Deltaproteobacteria bacterium]
MLDQPNRARAHRSIVTFVAMALLLTLWGGERAEAQRGRGISLEELELSTDGGRGQQLALHYTLSRRARPDVQLHISVDRARRDQELVATLDHRSGWIPLGRARGRGVVDVSVRATDRAGRIVPMHLGRGLVVTGIELSTEVLVDRNVVVQQWGDGPPRRQGVRVDGPPPPRGGGSNLSSVAQACDRAFVGQDAEQACLREMQGLAAAEGIIQACDRAFVGEDSTLQCLRARALPETVVACDRAFVGESATLQCLRSQPAARVVASCDRMFVGEDATLRCVDIVGRSRSNDAEVDQAFQVCGRRVGESDELACLQDVLGRRRGRGRRYR